MTTHHKAAKKHSLSTVAGASMLLLGLALTGCSTTTPESASQSSTSTATQTADAVTTADVDVPTTASSTAPAAQPSEDAEPAEDAAEDAAVKDRKVTMHVEGANSQGLVKALVVTADGKETGGEMVTETLPFDQEVTLPANSVFTKVLVLGKYADGATGEISCSISIDGVSVASQTSSNHKPAECLFVEKAAK